MKYSIYKVIAILFLFVVLLGSPKSIIAQDKLLGELTIENNVSAIGEQFVTVNNERVISGRSIMSPAELETPTQTAAKVTIAKTGFIRIAPSSKMNLYFENASISGDLLRGNLTVDALPYTKFNIITPDGAVTASNINNENVFVINLADSKTQVKVLSGEVLFKGTLLVAGQTFPTEIGNSDAKKDDNSGSAGSSNIIYIVLGAAAAAAVIAAVSLSGGNDNNSVVSPVR
ncbi:hypothetical protein BH20ACI1_BH20ACI1_19550 [soil metagenome]